MSYNWQKIFENKTDKELFHIYLGKTHLNAEAKQKTKDELLLRNFSFDNLEKHKKKRELEELMIEEHGENAFFSFNPTRAKDYRVMRIASFIFISIWILNILFDFAGTSNSSVTFFDRIGLLLIGLLSFILGTIGFRSSKKKESKRKKRIEELIKEL